ncbi:hypothetical protein MMB17_02985 [Methylobacterium organophilum]|uniref:hypothetical protein n=1 Tax=Methylobacterium organophilum TaxID=410 RepID=UPI001F131B6C|nr:hypothetical protein [Methylobacterium organophilum]UMY18328.1 hypothetical protein MMB17_02985 [Methylobacterium organophilum]
MTSQPLGSSSQAAFHPPPAPSDGTRLWRRRLFEAEAGLTRFVAETRAGAQMEQLLRTKRAIFEQLPEREDESEWKAAFFRGQALMERFVVESFGLEQLAAWAAANSTIYAAVDAEPKHDATVPLRRLDEQASLYDSQKEWIEYGSDQSTLRIRHCAIWDYRELARKRGVQLTLKAPCEYCVPAVTAMITNKGLHATHELTENEEGQGCIWTASHVRVS